MNWRDHRWQYVCEIAIFWAAIFALISSALAVLFALGRIFRLW